MKNEKKNGKIKSAKKRKLHIRIQINAKSAFGLNNFFFLHSLTVFFSLSFSHVFFDLLFVHIIKMRLLNKNRKSMKKNVFGICSIHTNVTQREEIVCNKKKGEFWCSIQETVALVLWLFSIESTVCMQIFFFVITKSDQNECKRNKKKEKHRLFCRQVCDWLRHRTKNHQLR